MIDSCCLTPSQPRRSHQCKTQFLKTRVKDRFTVHFICHCVFNGIAINMNLAEPEKAKPRKADVMTVDEAQTATT